MRGLSRLRSRVKRSPSRSPKQQSPSLLTGALVFGGDSDDGLLSRGLPRTIIGAASFHGPVRDGKAWAQRAMVVRESGIRAQGAGNSTTPSCDAILASDAILEEVEVGFDDCASPKRLVRQALRNFTVTCHLFPDLKNR